MQLRFLKRHPAEWRPHTPLQIPKKLLLIAVKLSPSFWNSYTVLNVTSSSADKFGRFLRLCCSLLGCLCWNHINLWCLSKATRLARRRLLITTARANGCQIVWFDWWVYFRLLRRLEDVGVVLLWWLYSRYWFLFLTWRLKPVGTWLMLPNLWRYISKRLFVRGWCQLDDFLLPLWSPETICALSNSPLLVARPCPIFRLSLCPWWDIHSLHLLLWRLIFSSFPHWIL